MYCTLSIHSLFKQTVKTDWANITRPNLVTYETR